MRAFLRTIQDENTRNGLRYSTWDGILWAVMYGLAESYVVPFALLFTDSAFQLSLIQGSVFLATCAGQLWGARLVAAMPRRKPLAVWMLRMQASCWLLIFAVSVWTGNAAGVLVFYFLSILAPNIGGPGWTSWMYDLIPAAVRGQYWGERNKWVGYAQLVSMAAAGVALHLGKRHELAVFGILFALGFLARLLSSVAMTKQYEPPQGQRHPDAERITLAAFISDLTRSNFGRFALFNFCMAFAINIMEPMINVYALQALRLDYMRFSMLSTIRILISFSAMAYWGPLSDRYGSYRILKVTTRALPLIALCWLVFRNFYVLLLLQGFTGFVLAGMNLAILNYQFDAMPRHQIAKISAYFNTLMNLCAFGGTLLGGYLTNVTPHLPLNFLLAGHYEVIFLLSALIRLATLLAFRKRFQEVRAVEPSPRAHYFYIYKPVTNVINRFQLLTEWFTNSANHDEEERR